MPTKTVPLQKQKSKRFSRKTADGQTEMADDQVPAAIRINVVLMVRHLDEMVIDVGLKVGMEMALAGQKVHRREVMAIVEARRTNGMVMVTVDRADLRTWIVVADLRKVAMLIGEPADVTPKVARQKAVTNHALQ